MNHLVSIRTNILYGKKEKKDQSEPDEFNRYQELIFLLDKPTYKRTNDGEIIRERGIEEVRFTVSQNAFEELLKVLIKLKDVEESDLS